VLLGVTEHPVGSARHHDAAPGCQCIDAALATISDVSYVNFGTTLENRSSLTPAASTNCPRGHAAR
jgi:hypothetical protein